MVLTLKVYCLCHLTEDGTVLRFVVIIVMNGIMVTVWESDYTLSWKWKMITSNTFVPAALQIVRWWVLLVWGHLPHLLLVHVNLVWIFSGWDKDGATFCNLIGEAYEVVVHWRCNSFIVFSGNSGKDCVLELARPLD